MRKILAATALSLASASLASAQPAIDAATLPDARSVAIGDPATYFGVIANNGDSTAVNCRIEKLASDSSPTTLSYQTVATDNTLIGTPDTPVDIVAGATQNFLITLTPNAEFENTVGLTFVCDNASAFGRPGVNDVFLVASTGTPADVLAIMVTPSGDGVIRVADTGGIQLAAGALTNLQGGTVNVTATPRFLGLDGALGHTLTICESDPATGNCLATASEAVDMTIGSGTQTFSVFLDANDDIGIPFAPEFVRVVVDFEQRRTNSLGPVRGRSSVAATAPSPFEGQSDVPLLGVFQIRFHDEVNDPGGEDIFAADLAILPDGTGYGTFVRTDFFLDPLQAFRVVGTSFPDANGGGIYSGELTFLEDVRFNDLGVARGNLTLAYTGQGGFFGEYSFVGNGAAVSGLLDASRTSSRIRSQGINDKVGADCSVFTNNDDVTGEAGVAFDIYFGDEPFEGREPDGVANVEFFDQGTGPFAEYLVTGIGNDQNSDNFEGVITQDASVLDIPSPLAMRKNVSATIAGREFVGPQGTLVGCSATGFTMIIYEADGTESVIVHFRLRHE